MGASVYNVGCADVTQHIPAKEGNRWSSYHPDKMAEKEVLYAKWSYEVSEHFVCAWVMLKVC